MAPTENRIMIFGPKDDGTYVVEFRTAAGEALAISIPRGEAAVISGTSRSACRLAKAGERNPDALCERASPALQAWSSENR
jgi:hypothetical protein